MGCCKLKFIANICIFALVVDAALGDTPFDDNYEVVWGSDHVNFLNERRDVQLLMDINHGAGFGSKLSYGSGFFSMRMKLHKGDSAGVVTTFYLTSSSSNHDELDFEFLGNVEGKPVTLQKNVFANGIGDREQRITLVSADVKYPSQAMKVEASLWHGDWASETKTNWSHAPSTAQYQGFDIDGCPFPQNGVDCNDPKYWWNGSQYWKLNDKEQGEMEQVRQKYMTYDYCVDRNRYPIAPPECAFNK